MNLTVRNRATSNIVYSTANPATDCWKFELSTTGSSYTFTGSNQETKLKNAFQNVSNYRNGLTKMLEFFDVQLRTIRDQANVQATVINHNFVEACKHVGDPLTDLLPKFSGKLRHSEKLSNTKKHLQKLDYATIAAAALDIDRAITNLQTQILGMQIIADEYEVDKSISHNLVTLIDNFLVPFDQNLEEKSIRIVNGSASGLYDSRTLQLDYDLMNWAFYHLLNNAVKYCSTESSLVIKSDIQSKLITIEMVSLRVEPGEAKKIFELGQRGVHAEGFPGDGLGMYFARASLQKMGAKVEFVPGNVVEKNYDGKDYCRNRIEIQL